MVEGAVDTGAEGHTEPQRWGEPLSEIHREPVTVISAVSRNKFSLRVHAYSRLSSLPTEEDNHLGWFCVDDDGNQTKKDMHPLLVGHMPVMVARQPEFKVRALCPWLASLGPTGHGQETVSGPP